MVDDDTFAALIASYALADGDDRAGHLVAEDARGGMGAGVDLFQVGPADAASGDLDEQLAGADGGHRQRSRRACR